MPPEFVSVGYAIRDRVDGREQFGGSVLYSAKTAQKWGLKTGILTSAEPKFLEASFLNGIEIACTDSKKTTTFEHRYEGASGERVSRCTEWADPIDVKTLPATWKSARHVLIGPNWQEVTPEAIKWFKSKWIALAPQGWFRAAGQSPWQLLPRKVALTVVSEEDLSRDSKAWSWISKFSDVAVRTDGSKAFRVRTLMDEREIKPPFVAENVDPTGAGDVFSTVMLIFLAEEMDPFQAAKRASVAASFAVEKFGFEGLPTKEQVIEREKRISNG